MAPKKRGRQAAKSSSTAKSSSAAKSGKKRPRGLLGLTSGYNSESDDDYQPTVPSKKHQHSPVKARASKQLHCCSVPAVANSCSQAALWCCYLERSTLLLLLVADFCHLLFLCRAKRKARHARTPAQLPAQLMVKTLMQTQSAATTVTHQTVARP